MQIAIEIEYYNESKNESTSEDYKVTRLNSLSGAGSSFIVIDDKMGVDENDKTKNYRYLEIYKIAFLAACEIKLNDSKQESQILLACYTDGEGTLIGFAMNGLPKGYYSHQNGTIIDYESYEKSCSYTGEKPMTFVQYYESKKNMELGPGTLLYYNGETLNYQQQTALWAKLDNPE